MESMRSALGGIHDSLSRTQIESEPTMDAESMNDTLMQMWLKLYYLIGKFFEVMSHFGVTETVTEPEPQPESEP